MNIFESSAPQQGQRATESVYRKIELQAPADLTYLIANVSRAARDKIDKHLPPDAAPEGDDAMRRRVEQLVDEYIKTTFAGASNSISINGMDSAEMEAELAKAQEGEEIEPYDTKLAQRVQTLSSQIEAYTLQLSNLRRTAPASASEAFQTSFTKQSESFNARVEQSKNAKIEEAQSTKMEIGDFQRWDEVEQSWQRGTESMAGLKSGLGETVASLERSLRAVNHIEGR